MDGRPSLTKTQAKLNITKDGKTCMTQAKLNITKDFLKSLRSLEEFRKNPHVKIPPKSPSINFQSLGKFKNPIFTSEILFLDFGPADLAAHPASQPSQPTGRAAPVGRNRPGRPILPRVDRVFAGNMSSLLVRAFRAGSLSHVSLSTRP
jgi:hypothetical protein